MRAIRFAGVGRPAEIGDVPKPSPGPGQIVIKIGGAGVCHSDLHVMEEDLGFKPPFTLGHENAGWVAERGGGVAGVKEGDAVAVYGPWGCGRCHACQRSMENYCENWAAIDGFGGGLGLDGGMAEYRHMAIQLLRVLAPVRIVAADVDDKKLEQAKALGAHDVVNNRNAAEAAERIQRMTGPRGAGLVLDCVGVQQTVDLGAKLLGRNSVWTIVGLGGGHHDFHHGSTPYGCSVSIPYWGSRVELMEVIAMARNGQIHAETVEFPLEQAVEVYEKLKGGQITGRAVLTP